MVGASQWQKALSDLDAGLKLPKDFSTQEFSGYLPVRLKGRKAGFEYFFGTIGQDMLDLSDRLGDRNRMVTLVPRDELELNAAMWAAAALAQCANGLFYDPQSEELVDAADALEIARKGEVAHRESDDEDEEAGDSDVCGQRQDRKGDAFDQELDATIVPVLAAEGFLETVPYHFSRADVDRGRDLVIVAVDEDYFFISLGYVPQYMEEICRLFVPSDGDPAPGMLRLLAPTVIVRGGGTKFYPCKSAAKLKQSMRLVHQGLTGVAFQWLKSLRDKSIYASELQSENPICNARAFEAADMIEPARRCYGEQVARTLDFYRKVSGSLAEFANTFVARTLVYSALKIKAERELCAQIMQSGGFQLKVDPLPACGHRGNDTG